MYFTFHWDYTLKYSLRNCHVKGLHSLAIRPTDRGGMVRLYIHEPGGDLGGDFQLDDLPLAIHPHAQDLTLICIKGNFRNLNFVKVPHGRPFRKYGYASKILTGENHPFSQSGIEHLEMVESTVLLPGDTIHLPAEQLHTVVCPKNSVSAWLVLEGERIEHSTDCYSTRDLSNVSNDGLYLPMDIKDVLQVYKLLDEA